MKKSEHYQIALEAVVLNTLLCASTRIEVIQTLLEAKELELFREKQGKEGENNV